MHIEDARKLAYDADLDLVEVAPNAKPPVCKIMDYGKFKYEQAQKAREARKNQQQTVVKEQKFRPKIDDHDYETKKSNVIRFLEKGSKVKVTIMFRGREQSRPELGTGRGCCQLRHCGIEAQTRWSQYDHGLRPSAQRQKVET